MPLISPPLELHLLGHFEVWCSNNQLKMRECGPKAKAILAYLAVVRRCSRQELSEMFCPKTENPKRSFRRQLQDIRKDLPTDLLINEGKDLCLDNDNVWVDWSIFMRILDRNLKEQSLESIEKAVNLYRGRFLADLTPSKVAPEFEQWQLNQQAVLQSLYERGLGELIHRLIKQGQYEKAIVWAQKLVQVDPSLEKAHIDLIRLYAQTGQKSLAIQQYEICRDILNGELAVTPSKELEQLYAEVVSGHAIQLSTPSSINVSYEDSRGLFSNFVGREGELTQLHQAWEGPSREGVVLIEAEAGGGKTRLVTEFSALLSGTTFLVGRCYESTQALPYRPWIDILETYLSELEDDLLNDIPPLFLDQLIRLLPGLARRLNKYTPIAPPTSIGQLEDLFNAIGEIVLWFPKTMPKLIFVDNLQWADELSITLFQYLARRIVTTRSASSQVLLIGAIRPEEVSSNTALEKLVNDLHRMAIAPLELPPLNQDAVTTLLSHVQPGLLPEYIEQLSTRLRQVTKGNPLFLTAILSELNLSNQNWSEIFHTLPLPTNVRESLHDRLQEVPGTFLQVLETIAVFGLPITFETVQQISARSEEETVTAIDLGLRLRLLEAQEKVRPAHYDCAHDLIREVLLLEMGSVRRRLLHRRAATTLIERAGRTAPAQRFVLANRIVYHAMEGEAFDVVLNWVPFAIDYGREIGAHTNALIACEYGLEALSQIHGDDYLPKEILRQKLNLLLEHVELLYPLGRRPEGKMRIEEASTLLAQHLFPELQAKHQLIRAYYLGAEAEYEAAYEAALEAHNLFFTQKNQINAAEALFRAGEIKMFTGDNRSARDLLQESLLLYRTGGDRGKESVCLSSLAWCAFLLGEIEVAIDHLEQAIHIADEHKNAYGLAHAYVIMAAAWYFYYNARQVRIYAQKALHLCRELRINSLLGASLLFLGASYLTEQVYDQAEMYFVQALNEAQSSEDFLMEGWAVQALGRLALRRGDDSTADKFLHRAYTLREAIGDKQGIVNDLAWLARLYMTQGKVKKALEYTTEAVDQLERLQGHVYVWESHDVLLCHAESLSANNYSEEAGAYIKRAHETLLQFANRISDKQSRKRFLDYPISQRTITAWESGRVPPQNTIPI